VPSRSKLKIDLELLDFKKESKKIKQRARESGKAVVFHKTLLTTNHLLDLIKKEPSVLHICCHGLLNTENNLATQKDGNYMVFESENGCGHSVSH